MQIQIDKFPCRALSGESTRLTGVSKPPSVSFVRGWNLKLWCQGFSCSLSLTLCWNWKNIVQGFYVYIVRYLPSNFFMELMKPTVARMEICAGLYRPCCQNTEHNIGTYYYIHCIYYLSVGLTMNWHTSLECWANNNILDRCSDGCHLLLLLRPRCNWTPWPTTTRVNRGCPANNLANRITKVF